jgi:hypothetical protein
MIKINWIKIFLAMFFTFALFSVDYADGMFNNQGQWICSGDIDIEKSYYELYTDVFQKTIDQVYFNDGAKAVQSYFEYAVDAEVIGQDWKRSQVCLVRLGVDITELSQIVIPADKIQALPNPDIRLEIDKIDDSSSRGEILPTDDQILPTEEKPPSIEKFEPKTTNNSYYFVAVAIIISVIITLGLFFMKSRTKYQSPETNSKDYKKNDETKDEPYQSIEIEINGGIEK